MGQKLEQARQLDALASATTSLAEAQALQARADQLRRGKFEGRWLRTPYIRN